MNNQRLRNLTTGFLHTKMADIYEDIEFLVGQRGIMTHHLPNANRALEPWLREQIADQRFWDGVCDGSHTGETAIEPMNEAAKAEFWKRFEALPSPFAKAIQENRVVFVGIDDDANRG